jgi:hypothetical protein
MNIVDDASRNLMVIDRKEMSIVILT